MAVVNNIFITKVEQAPHHKPLKQVDAAISVANGESIPPSLFGLKTILNDPILTSGDSYYTVAGYLNGPYGSPDNGITVDITFIATSGAPVAASGSHPVNVRVIGD